MIRNLGARARDAERRAKDAIEHARRVTALGEAWVGIVAAIGEAREQRLERELAIVTLDRDGLQAALEVLARELGAGHAPRRALERLGGAVTPELVAEVVEDVRGLSGDDEAAHGLEDDLRAAVLAAISEGRCELAAACAREALRTDSIRFARYRG